MTARKRLAGVMPAVATPFHPSSGEVDTRRLSANLRWLLEGGVDGVLVLGSTGEFASLDEAERYPVLDAAREVVPESRLLVVGVGAESTPRTIRQVKAAASAGADAVVVVTPSYYTRQDVAALRYHYLTVADSTPVQVLLYNVPIYTALDLPVPLALELAQHENITGIKDSAGDLTQIYNLIADSPVGWAVFTGSSGLAAATMAGGGAGSMTACANYAPELMVDLRIAVEMDDMEAAMRFQRTIVALEGVVGRYRIPGVKEACDLRGHSATPVRAPLRPVSDEARRMIAAALKVAGLSITL